MYRCEVCNKLVTQPDDAYKTLTKTDKGYDTKDVCRKCAGVEKD